MTDEELDALVTRMDDMSDISRDHAAGLLDLGHKVAVHQAIAAITTLRAQLAEARAERDVWEIDAKRNHQAAEIEFARADRAEAALAAQIEVDAGMIERIVTEARQEVGSTKLSKVDAAVVEMLSGIAKAIRNQPHDRTALDRHDAKTREKALQEVLEKAKASFYGVITQDAILALIEKPNAR